MGELLSRRGARALLVFLFVVKLAISVWNAYMFPSRGGYDYAHHEWRVKSAGLDMGKMAYNPPLYYLPVLPRVHPGVRTDPLLDQLRYMNVVYLAAFYAAWVFILFPRMLPDPRASTLAGALLLSLPGYQKAAVMVHPDNLLMALSALSFAFWFWIEEQRVARLSSSLGLALLSGLTGLTRPFAVLPVLMTWALNLRASFRAAGRRFFSVRFLGRAVAVTLLIGVMSSGWYAYRYAKTGYLTNIYLNRYVEIYQPVKKTFNYQKYYTTFYYKKLLDTPNRSLTGKEQPSQNPMANTFFTIFYSETWGDHWLYFSGAKNPDGKLWVKRTLFVVALPATILLVLGFFAGAVRAVVAAVRERQWVSPRTVMLVMAIGGFGLFLYWQGGAGLLPGKNSSIKFLYVAHAIPYIIAIALWFRPRRRIYHGLLALCLLVYGAALPMATFWPAVGKQPTPAAEPAEPIDVEEGGAG